MIAALPMYDWPEVRDATDRLWAGVRDRLRAAGIAAPDRLTRDRDVWEIWTDPGLVLAQTCALPYRTRLRDRVRLVGAPDLGLAGCAPGQYTSVIVARAGALPERPRLAVNGADSQSGWGAFATWLAAEGIAPGPAVVTGAHRASARAVAGGEADLACIDAASWRLVEAHDGPQGLVEIARTPPTEATPFITAATDPAPHLAALSAALADLAPRDREAIGLRGVVAAGEDAYPDHAPPPKPWAFAAD